MENKDLGRPEADQKADGRGSRRFRYCVLFVQTLKQWEVTEAIQRRLPEGRGTVFYPCVELWMGSLGRTVIEPLFPGYVCIRSDMGRDELHEFIRGSRREVLSFIKELSRSRERAAGEDGFHGEDEPDDLSGEEAELLDFMLGFRYGAEGQAPDGGYPEIKAGEAEKNSSHACMSECLTRNPVEAKSRWHTKIPAAGVMGMSYGYREKDGRYVVMEGPLRGHEGSIVDVNPRDRRAYLNIKVGGRLARAGLTLKGKRYWYPKDTDAPVVLGDGTEVNLNDIAAAMMGCRHEKH